LLDWERELLPFADTDVGFVDLMIGSVVSVRGVFSSLLLLLLLLTSTPESVARQDVVLTWGLGSDLDLLVDDLVDVASTAEAFAAVSQSGAVTVWGSAQTGGDISGIETELQSGGGVERIIGNKMAFCALKNDGTVVTWPSQPWSGGDSSSVQNELTGISDVYANEWSFVAVKPDGRLVAWGDELYGGKVPVDLEMSVPVKKIVSTKFAYAVLREDNSVVTWGQAAFGGDSSSVVNSLLDNVVDVVATKGGAFAAIKSDGSVVTWGNPKAGGDSSGVQKDLVGVVKVVATFDAFAALTDLGQVFAWGDSVSGGNLGIVEGVVRRGVEEVFATQFAFAALKADGSVKTWGDPLYGGNSNFWNLERGVEMIVSNPYAFAALRDDGTVVSWGNEKFGGSMKDVNGDFFAMFELYKSLTRCKLNAFIGGISSDNNLEDCARRCAASSRCEYFSYNWDENKISKRCTIYDDSCGEEDKQLEATSQDLYILATDIPVSERREMVDNSLTQKRTRMIYANDFAFLAETGDGKITAWGDPSRGGDLQTQEINDKVRSVYSNRAGFAVVLD